MGPRESQLGKRSPRRVARWPSPTTSATGKRSAPREELLGLRVLLVDGLDDPEHLKPDGPVRVVQRLRLADTGADTAQSTPAGGEQPCGGGRARGGRRGEEGAGPARQAGDEARGDEGAVEERGAEDEAVDSRAAAEDGGGWGGGGVGEEAHEAAELRGKCGGVGAGARNRQGGR